MTRLGRLFVFLFSVSFTTMVLNGTAISVSAGIAAVILAFVIGAGFGRHVQQRETHEREQQEAHNQRMEKFR